MNALSIADIGLTPTVTLPAAATVEVGDEKVPPEMRLVPGSVFAQVIYHMWKGTECVIVKSPPGGGKSTLVANVADVLRRNVPEQVTIITPTNAAATTIGKRMLAAFGTDVATAQSSGIVDLPMIGTNVTASDGGRVVGISTIASAVHQKPTGIVIVDEAYQASFADVSQAVDRATQVLMVGDPGQIGPVVTIDTSMFEDRDFGPHSPAPTVFERNPDAVVLSLASTFRLGDETTEVVNEMYDFEFDSQRLPHSVDGLGEVETVEVEDADSHSSPDLLENVVDRVLDVLGRTHRYVDHTTRQAQVHAIEPWHIAVVVAHNVQAAYIKSRLTSITGHPALDLVEVGTADRLQGGQWPAVIALDPLAGVHAVTDHHTSLGRLCVMLSRHTSHLSFLHEKSWRTRLSEATDLPRSEARAHRRVRGMLGA